MLHFPPVKYRLSIVLCLLLAVTLFGCAQEAPVNIPPPSAEAIARVDAIKRRVVELKKQYPKVPDSVLAGRASQELSRGSISPR